MTRSLAALNFVASSSVCAGAPVHRGATGLKLNEGQTLALNLDLIE